MSEVLIGRKFILVFIVLQILKPDTTVSVIVVIYVTCRGCLWKNGC